MAGYGTDDGFTAWLADNGYDLPAGAPAVAVLRQRGSVYIDALYGSRFVGVIADPAQERQWPRERALVSGKMLPADVVPGAVISAAYQAALQEAKAPGKLTVIGSTASAVKRVKVGPLEKEYQGVSADAAAINMTPVISLVDGMLAPFLRDRTIPYVGLWSIGGC